MDGEPRAESQEPRIERQETRTKSQLSALGLVFPSFFPWALLRARASWPGADIPRVGDVTSDLAKADGRIEVPADRVLFQRLDLGHGHPLGAEAVERVFQEEPAESLVANPAVDGQVVNPPDEGLAVKVHRDVADRLAGRFILGQGELAA